MCIWNVILYVDVVACEIWCFIVGGWPRQRGSVNPGPYLSSGSYECRCLVVNVRGGHTPLETAYIYVSDIIFSYDCEMTTFRAAAGPCRTMSCLYRLRISSTRRIHTRTNVKIKRVVRWFNDSIFNIVALLIYKLESFKAMQFQTTVRRVAFIILRPYLISTGEKFTEIHTICSAVAVTELLFV